MKYLQLSIDHTYPSIYKQIWYWKGNLADVTKAVFTHKSYASGKHLLFTASTLRLSSVQTEPHWLVVKGHMTIQAWCILINDEKRKVNLTKFSCITAAFASFSFSISTHFSFSHSSFVFLLLFLKVLFRFTFFFNKFWARKKLKFLKDLLYFF